MSEHKLVPFEPTPEMIEAAEDAHMPFGDMDLALRMAVLAAPAVQGEPVGYVRPHQLEALRSGKVCGITMEDKPDAHNRVTIPLYTAPQPAEQQPPADGSLTPVPDELFAAEFNAWWEQHGQFCRAGGGDYERTFAFEAWRHLYPQLMNLQMAAAEQRPACASQSVKSDSQAALSAESERQAPDVSALVEVLEGALSGRPLDTEFWDRCEQFVAAHRKQGGE